MPGSGGCRACCRLHCVYAFLLSLRPARSACYRSARGASLMPVMSARVRPVTVAGLLRLRAAESAEREAYLFLADGEVEGERLTWGELDRRARTIARALREALRPGDRALLLYPPGLDFVA